MHLSSVQRTKVIVNPTAGGGATEKTWPQIYSRLKESNSSIEAEFSRNPGHAIQLARQAVDNGYSHIIAVGGDGTLNEVANGILRSPKSTGVTLGIVSTGTSCGFARHFGLSPENTGRRVSRLNQRKLMIDVGVVDYTELGQRRRRFFLNEASAGIGAATVVNRKNLPNHMSRSGNLMFYSIAAYYTLFNHHNKNVRLNIDGYTEDLRACYLIVSNGQYFANGMRIAPHADLGDGLLNLVTIGDVGKYELYRIASAAYYGGHLSNPRVSERKIKTVIVECGEKLFVETDGEALGECPATFSVMPSALALMV